MNPTIKKHNDEIIGYKAFKTDKNGNLYTYLGDKNTRTEFKFGDIISIEGEPELCKNGIHFFRHYCFAIDYLEPGNVIHKIRALGTVVEDTEKCVTNKIEILEKVYEYLDKKNNAGNGNTGNRNAGNRNAGDYNAGNRNAGDYNAGYWNAGDYNAGDWNTGSYNSGNRNAGDYNAGYWNTGSYNSGNRNAGNYNSGRYNTGNGNAGDYNTGDYNSGNDNAGNGNAGDGYINYFCTNTRYFLFDKECTREDALLYIDFSWFNLSEKTYKQAWSEAPYEILDKIMTLKNFNAKKFYQISGWRKLKSGWKWS